MNWLHVVFVVDSVLISTVLTSKTNLNLVDFYTSQDALEKLAKVEASISNAVGDYIKVLERRLLIAKRLEVVQGIYEYLILL